MGLKFTARVLVVVSEGTIVLVPPRNPSGPLDEVEESTNTVLGAVQFGRISLSILLLINPTIQEPTHGDRGSVGASYTFMSPIEVGYPTGSQFHFPIPHLCRPTCTYSVPRARFNHSPLSCILLYQLLVPVGVFADAETVFPLQHASHISM